MTRQQILKTLISFQFFVLNTFENETNHTVSLQVTKNSF